MKIFLDTAAVDEIRVAKRWGVLDGVTTNPSLFAKVGGSYDEVIRQICQITPGPVSAEVVAADVEGMLREGRHFAKLAALAGAHIATVPLKVLRQMIHHPLTDSGIEQFRRDWKAVEGQSSAAES